MSAPVLIALRNCAANAATFVAAVALTAGAGVAKADVLHHLKKAYTGRIVAVSVSDVKLEIGCDPTRIITLDKASIGLVELNARCTDAVASSRPAIEVPTCATPVRGWEAAVSGLAARPFVKDFDFFSPLAVLLRYHDDSVLIVERGKLERMFPTLRCEIDPIPHYEPGPFAAGLCYEPRAWAVAFTGRPVSRNQIFTQGFSIFVATGDRQGAAMPDVREAFGHALTLWTAALERIRNELDPDLKAFIDRSTSRSATGGYALLTPPQAVRRFCRETAMFEVRWVTDRGLAFPEKDQHILAKAQFQGRTVLVNAIDHAFSLKLNAVRADDGTHSLVSIMAHELGHAFGIGHDHASPTSIMSPNASRMSRDPTDEDARQLARVLLQEIKGLAPGEVSFAACEGLSSQ
jgi:Matrixin